MNANVQAGATVYLRGGITSSQISPAADGSLGSPIVIEAYESERFTISNRTASAINLTSRDYITLRKIWTRDVRQSVVINAGTNNRFENCDFQDHKNDSGWVVAVSIQNDSQFNTFTNCIIGECGYEYDGQDIGSCVNLGLNGSETDETRFNYFVDCTLFRGGHDVLSDYSSFNHFDRCFFYNDEWYGSQPYGNRCFITEDDVASSFLNHGNTTFRDCLFHRSGDPPDGDGVGIMSLRTQRNRVIRCVFVDGANSGLGFDSAYGSTNRIANSVFVRNGVNTPNTDSGQRGGITVDFVGGTPQGNKIFNCIFESNFSDLGQEGTPIAQIWANNWLEAAGNPNFIDWSTGDLDPDNKNAHDFRLASGSGCINNGGWLTTVTSTGSGTVLFVADSIWFTDGNGIAPGDVIQLQGSATKLTVTDVNYSTHTLTISPSTSWSSGTGIAFAYSGSAPDQGAFESAMDAIAPKLVSAIIPNHGTNLVLQFDEAVLRTIDNLAVNLSGGPSTATFANGSGTTVMRWNLSRKPDSNETGTFTVSTGLTDASANPYTASSVAISNQSTNNPSGQVATPVIALSAGPYWGPQLVSIACTTPGSSIYYTLDGSDPDETDLLYTAPVSIVSSRTLKAIGVHAVHSDSAIASAAYEIDSWTAGATWKGVAFANQTTNFYFSVEVTPSGTNLDLVIGLSESKATDYPQLAVPVRFHQTGVLQAMDGTAYTAENVFNYTTNSQSLTGHVNFAAREFSLTADGITIAANYGFRSTAAMPSSLGWINFRDSSGGASETENLKIWQEQTAPPKLNLTITSAGDVRVEFETVPGRRYQIERTTNLRTWDAVWGPLIATNSSQVWIDSNPPTGAAYYRARILP
jgi:hypothetical protein